MARAMDHPVAYLMAYPMAHLWPTHPKFCILPIMKKKFTYAPREQAFKLSDGSRNAFQ